MRHRDEAGLLNGILRLSAIPDERDGSREHARAMTLEQRAQRGGIALARGENKLGVARLWRRRPRGHDHMMHRLAQKFEPNAHGNVETATHQDRR